MSLVKVVSASALLAGLGAVGTSVAAAQDYRLAFSKAENIEIFVEGATAENWCASTLKLRAVHGGAYDAQALNRLLPKLGGLFAQQCPQASQLQWRSLDASGELLAQGSSRAKDGWAAVTTPVSTKPEQATAQQAQDTTQQTQETHAMPETHAQTSALAAAQAGTSTPADDQQAVAPASESRRQTEAVQQATGDAGAAAVATAIDVRSVIAGTGSASTAAEGADRPDSSSEHDSRAIGLSDFAVAGWQPPSDKERETLRSFLATLEDQNGCKIVSFFNLGEGAAYLNLVTEGVSCGADGFAQGKGRLRLERSDGAQLLRTGELWFSHGLIFDDVVMDLRPEDIVAVRDNRTVWFGLGSDAQNRSHYLLRAELGQFSGGVGAWKLRPQLDVLTEGSEAFRQAAQIRVSIDRALSVLQTTMPNANSVWLMFADDVQNGVWENSRRHQLYAIGASRRYDYRTRKPQGPWQYNLQQASNYLFEREARLAEEKRMQEQQQARERQIALARQARVERDNLQRYTQLKTLAAQDPAKLRAEVERDIHYVPGSSSAYARLVRGGSDNLMRIVRVDGHKGDNAVVDWPYPMWLEGQKSLKKGWYWINGVRRLDPSSLDEDDLPISIVNVSEGGVHACDKDGCTDFLDPLAIMRLQLGDADWTPEAAQTLIDSAPKSLW